MTNKGEEMNAENIITEAIKTQDLKQVAIDAVYDKVRQSVLEFIDSEAGIKYINEIAIGIIEQRGDNRPSIHELEMSIRSENCLLAEGIYYIDDLLKYSDVQLLKTPNFGKKALAEVKDVLRMRGLYLKGDRP